MTINWLICKNETCVALRRSAKYRPCSTLNFIDYPLMVGSVRKAVRRCRNSCFWQYAGDDSAYNLVFFNRLKQSKRVKLWNEIYLTEN